MTDKLNALGFCSAAALYSSSRTAAMEPHERAKVLADFHDGRLNALCVVDIFNEGIDVPDVNIIVFQRVTHSRRIFIQQLGRGLRIAPHKNKVIVLDFVSDIRRFAAGISLRDSIKETEGLGNRAAARVQLPSKVRFRRAGEDDPQSESFLRQWLDDVAAVEEAGEDAAVLKFPPMLEGSHK
jgi:superfamily II DNA or RNA helicase